MKERNELARAMNDLPDDLLLETEQTARTGKVIKFRRFVAAAAVIALLAVTAGAVTVGIDWTLTKVSRQEMIEEFGPIYDEKFKYNFYLGGHLNAAGYLLTAQIVMSYIDYIIRHNPEDFAQVGFVGTEFHNETRKW